MSPNLAALGAYILFALAPLRLRRDLLDLSL